MTFLDQREAKLCAGVSVQVAAPCPSVHTALQQVFLRRLFEILLTYEGSVINAAWQLVE